MEQKTSFYHGIDTSGQKENDVDGAPSLFFETIHDENRYLAILHAIISDRLFIHYQVIAFFPNLNCFDQYESLNLGFYNKSQSAGNVDTSC